MGWKRKHFSDVQWNRNQDQSINSLSASEILFIRSITASCRKHIYYHHSHPLVNVNTALLSINSYLKWYLLSRLIEPNWPPQAKWSCGSTGWLLRSVTWLAWLRFWECRWLVSRYCSYLLPKRKMELPKSYQSTQSFTNLIGQPVAYHSIFNMSLSLVRNQCCTCLALHSYCTYQN